MIGNDRCIALCTKHLDRQKNNRSFSLSDSSREATRTKCTRLGDKMTQMERWRMKGEKKKDGQGGVWTHEPEGLVPKTNAFDHFATWPHLQPELGPLHVHQNNFFFLLAKNSKNSREFKMRKAIKKICEIAGFYYFFGLFFFYQKKKCFFGQKQTAKNSSR